MIRSLEISNFRSIRSLQLELRPFNCLVGPNNSGKSNLVDLLSFVHDLVGHGVAHAVNTHGGDAVRFYGSGPSDGIGFAVKFSPSADRSFGSVEYRAQLSSDSSHLFREELVGHNEGRPDVRIAESGTDPAHDGMYLYSYDSQRGPSSARHRESIVASVPLLRKFDSRLLPKSLLAEIAGWEFFNYSAETLKRPGPAVATDVLARDGRNFASYVHSVYSGHRKFFTQIEAELRKSFPDVEELLTPLTGNQTSVGIHEKWFNRAVSSNQLSDGVVEFLAHLVVIYGPTSPTLVAFEEPESHIHSKLMEKLVTILKEASKEVQIVITTHSPNLLNRLDLEDIILVDREQGQTSARRASDRHDLTESIKGWALGDALSSGLLESGA